MKSKLLLFLVLFSWTLIAADCSKLQKKLEADVWLVDKSDGTIYRNLKDGNREFIYCTDNSAELFS